MNYHVGVIAGDGIGPEVVAEAKKVLDTVGKKYGHTFDYEAILMGGCSIDATGVPLTDEAIAQAKGSDAVLMGSIGGNTATSPWYQLPPQLRPEIIEFIRQPAPGISVYGAQGGVSAAR